MTVELIEIKVWELADCGWGPVILELDSLSEEVATIFKGTLKELCSVVSGKEIFVEGKEELLVLIWFSKKNYKVNKETAYLAANY